MQSQFTTQITKKTTTDAIKILNTNTTNAIKTYSENTKQRQQQMQSQFTMQIQNNDNNKYDRNLRCKYKIMTKTNAIKILNTNSN